MSDNSTAIVSKVPPWLKLWRTRWNYPPSPSGLRRAGTHVIKNAGVGCGDCVDQIKVANHTKGNAVSEKKERPAIRVVPKSRFRVIGTTKELVEVLFGVSKSGESVYQTEVA